MSGEGSAVQALALKDVQGGGEAGVKKMSIFVIKTKQNKPPSLATRRP